MKVTKEEFIGVTYDELLALNDELLAFNDKLLAENELLKSDNAKLRELVRKVLQFERAGCEGCPYASTCDVDCLYEPNCPMREDIERDMRELEVDACPNCGAKVVEPTKNDVDVEVEQ